MKTRSTELGSSGSFFAFARSMSGRYGARSKPRARRRVSLATSSVVPDPQNGSTTRSPSFV
jgi:hypothetical protein